MSFTAYPEYKKLTFQALGCIPGHWSVVRFKQVYQEINERSEIGAEELLSVSEYYGVKPRSEKIQDGEHLTRAESLEGYKKCKPGDLVMNIMLAWKRGLGISNYVGIVSPAYAVFRNITRAEPRYFHYLLRTDEYIGYFKAYSAGVIDSRLRLYPEVFSRLVAITPPLGEQTQIARFLDHETAKIDALIAEQKRLIKLLQEKRQAVISHAVTKGLDPNVPMKDSGVEWLGEVPAHWRLSKLKFLIERLIDTEHKTVPFDDDGDFYVARTSDIRNGKLDLNDARRTDSEGYTEWTKRGAPRKGDIIFTREAPAGEACIVPVDDKICLGQRTVLIKLNEDLLISGFTLWSIYGGLASRFIKELSQGSTVSHINMSDIPNTPILLPPLNEQVDIDRYLMSMTGKYDLLMIESERLMLRLTERRSAIISAAVTGKIDVRNWQPPADESAFDGDVRKTGLEASA